MKICHFLYNEREYWGAFENGRIFPFPENDDLSETGEGLKLTRSVDAELVDFLPPMSPSKIVCVGRNYAEHAAELGNPMPAEPLLFLKAPSSLITERGQIVIPVQSQQVEHEAELAVVISKECSKLTSDDDPFEYVFGYTCLNDVTARDVQRSDVQFTRGKSFDTFCAVGATIETEADPSDLRVVCRVNGEIRQDGRTSQMAFPVGFLVRYISNQMTLRSGDIIATGTPSGVSKLNPGDVCEIEIEGVGTLSNSVT
ncbi:MAG: fumarylacetoacetate hydrolase family protein [Acidobacteria bacterium]|nr:fumarylacetoacetate hydrolase family protein [Acidobacteriota bacterium]